MKCVRFLIFAFCFSLLLLTSSAQQPAQPTSAAPPQSPIATGVPNPPVLEQIRKTVGFLSIAYMDGTARGGVIGTCFFVSIPDKRLGENRGFPYLVTNRHVAQPGIELGTPYDVQAVFIRLNLATPQGEIRSVQEQIPMGGRIRWFFPADDAVDLAVLPIGPDEKRYDYMTVPSTVIVSSDELKNGNFGVGDAVTFAGYFSSFPGQIRVQPIVRQGVIAMLPEEKLSTTLHKEGVLYLADLHAFHGNSGSPVFVNQSGFRHGAIYSGESYRLLGILSGYYPEAAGFSVPAAAVLTGEVRDNSGIATIVPADELIKLLNSPILQAEREAQLANVTKKP